MCFKPIKIRNPTEHIMLQGGQLLSMQVPCGKCAECLKTKRNEWYFRSYYQVQETLNKGGYILFDTLTYSDEHLPHLSDFIDINNYHIHDFSCFNHRHFKLFLKNLRRQLKYHCGNSDFRYFLTSEYGTDERFTHRPHYHILFYVTNGVNPLTFSKLISKCWSYGRTDGIEYRPLKYVAGHVYGYNLGFGKNTDFKCTSSVVNYVSKYITKHSKFREKLDKRIYALQSSGIDEELLKTVIRSVDMFHRQSKLFGLYYLNQLDENQLKLLDEDKVSMPDKKKINLIIPMPMYYKRHLYYTLCKREDKTYYWQLTDVGIDHNAKMKLVNVDVLTKNYNDIYQNLKSEFRQRIDSILNGRTLTDFVIYKLLYKGRLRDANAIDKRYMVTTSMTDEEYNLHDWLNIVNSSSFSNSSHCADLYKMVDDKIYIPKLNVDFNIFNFHNAHEYIEIDYSRFIDIFTFNQHSDDLFHGFDDLDNYFEFVQKETKEIKQKTFDFLEDYKERLKQLKLI